MTYILTFHNDWSTGGTYESNHVEQSHYWILQAREIEQRKKKENNRWYQTGKKQRERKPRQNFRQR